jgi:hypothetical protein
MVESQGHHMHDHCHPGMAVGFLPELAIGFAGILTESAPALGSAALGWACVTRGIDCAHWFSLAQMFAVVTFITWGQTASRICWDYGKGQNSGTAGQSAAWLSFI